MLDLLLVEDNQKLRRAMKSGLEASGEVRVVYDCASGEDALEYCVQEPQSGDQHIVRGNIESFGELKHARVA